MVVTPADRGPQVLAVYGLFLALSTLTVWFRVYCRTRIQKAFGLDDWFALASWVTFVLFVAFAMTGVFHGTGQHAWNIKPVTEIPVGVKYWWLCEPFYVLSSMAIKASIGIMLIRLSVKRTHLIILWVTMAIIQLYGAFFFFLFVFQCIPSSYFWTRYTGGSGKCIDTSVTVSATYGYSAITCAGDLVYSILPYFMIWNLQMKMREKILVILILAMAAIASAATIARIPYVHTLSNAEDFLYATTDVAIWSCCETGLGITAGCCATLRPLFRQWTANTRWASSSNKDSSGTDQYRLQPKNSSFIPAKPERQGYSRSDSIEALDNYRMGAMGGGQNGFGTHATAWHPTAPVRPESSLSKENVSHITIEERGAKFVVRPR